MTEIEKRRQDHLDGILHDLRIHVLPDILGYEDIEPDGVFLDDYSVDPLDGYEIECQCSDRWKVDLDLKLGFYPNCIITPLDLAMAIQQAQDDVCEALTRKRSA